MQTCFTVFTAALYCVTSDLLFVFMLCLLAVVFLFAVYFFVNYNLVHLNPLLSYISRSCVANFNVDCSFHVLLDCPVNISCRFCLFYVLLLWIQLILILFLVWNTRWPFTFAAFCRFIHLCRPILVCCENFSNKLLKFPLSVYWNLLFLIVLLFMW